MGRYILTMFAVFFIGSGVCTAAMSSVAIDSEPIAEPAQVQQEQPPVEKKVQTVKKTVKNTAVSKAEDNTATQEVSSPKTAEEILAERIQKKSAPKETTPEIKQETEAESGTITQHETAAKPVAETDASAGKGTPQNTPQYDQNVNKRFVLIAKDSHFCYYLDQKSARWIFEPNSTRKIMDVWIQLVDINKVAVPDNKYSDIAPDQSYLLDHYYIRPETRQVQFLCELEVVGQPSNNISQNAYYVKNWEDVVPGSVEETILNAMLSQQKSLVQPNTRGKEGIDTEAKNFLDRVFNIGL